MNRNLIPLDYVNNLVYELEKAFWDERGKGARFRMTNVGSKYFKEKCLPSLDTTDIEGIINKIGDILQEEGIVGKVDYSREERLFRIQVEGCLHRPVEEQMLVKGIEPFTCVPANLIALAIEEKLDRPVELAEIKLEEGSCRLLMVVFESRPTLG